MGQVTEHLASLTDIDYAVRPTCFMAFNWNNFSPQEPQRLSIKDGNRVYPATGDGRIPFASADDIARVAHHALKDLGQRISHS
ncbi:hypothetical protein BBP40_004845 [Aspergillus hancockii]|nr:hypothetical protein BBP40_004845 [Aspergillus hancockii]